MVVYGSIEEMVGDLEQNPVEASGHIYHPIPFPEFEHLKSASNSREVYRKLEVIKTALSSLSDSGISGMKVLDIGANAGFYAFNLAKEGAQVTAFEPHPRYGPMGQFLAETKQLDVKWHACPFDPKAVSGQVFDATLLLSVFQWMADGGSRMAEALEELRAISQLSKTLVFELGFNHGKSCIRTKRFNHYAELVKLLEGNTDYKYFKLLGTTRLWAKGCRYLVLCSNDKRFEDSAWRKLIRHTRI